MNADQYAEICKFIAIAWPNSPWPPATAKQWQRTYETLPYSTVWEALDTLLANGSDGFPPSPDRLIAATRERQRHRAQTPPTSPPALEPPPGHDTTHQRGIALCRWAHHHRRTTHTPPTPAQLAEAWTNPNLTRWNHPGDADRGPGDVLADGEMV